MPLSDHEQQLLDQLEKQLRSEDPRFAQNITQPRSEAGSPISAKRFVGGALALIAGAAVVVASIYLFELPFNVIGGVIGFAIMVLGGYWAVAGNETASAPAAGTTGSAEPSEAPAPEAPCRWRDVLTGAEFTGTRLQVAELLDRLPVAVLERVE